jgi:ATP-dependent RNA helicase RhlE
MTKSSTDGRQATGFARFDLPSQLMRAIEAAGYTSPRPIQEQGLPAALEGRDVLGLAQTGTGKTAAFVLPILDRLIRTKPKGQGGPRALVVAPTRELAAQVHTEFESLGRFTQITATPVFGGVPIARQERALRGKMDVVVACPGRLLDLYGQGAVRLDGVEVLVLDEADHMFDMGFLPDLRRILKALPPRRQNLLFSATMPREIRKLADTILHNPKVVELSQTKPAETIAHGLYPLDENDKIGALDAILASKEFKSAIVFTRTKRRAKQLAQHLDLRKHRAIALQGNMSQPQRVRAMEGFRSGTYDILVATDIAARGLDIAGVSHVINFDVPNTPEAYTHRIGRTGRSECTGTAYTFVTYEDKEQVRAIEKRLGAPIERHNVRDLGPIESTKLRALKPAGGGPVRGQGGQGGRGGRGASGGRGPGVGARSGSGRGGSSRGPGAAGPGRSSGGGFAGGSSRGRGGTKPAGSSAGGRSRRGPSGGGSSGGGSSFGAGVDR